MKGYTKIGKTGSTHGAEGELKVSILDQYLEDVLLAGLVFLKVEGQAIPFFPLRFRPGKSLIMKVEDVDTPEEAARLVGLDILLRPEDMRPNEERDLPQDGPEYAYLSGYLLYDEVRGEVGVIREVVEYPQQEMAVVDQGSTELLIPLHSHLIISVDRQENHILMRLPEGILDL